MILRRMGIRRRLVLSFLLVLVVPVAVSLGALFLSLSLLVPRAEASYAIRMQKSLEADYLPSTIEKLRLGEIQVLLAAGKTAEVTAVVKEVWPLLSDRGDSAEIVQEDGTVLFALGETRLAELFLPPAPLAGNLALRDGSRVIAPFGFGLVPGLSFVATSRARYVWQLAPDAEGAVYGRYTFTVPGAAGVVETVSGTCTAVAVGAGLVTFVIVVIVLSLRLSRSILVPLRRLSAAASDIAEGNLDVPVTATRADELGALAAAFEEMRVRLRESLVRLQRGDAERRAMVASVTHDLKTPLTSIRGYVEGLRDGVADNPEARDRYFAVILEKTARLEDLIDGLLRISRLELGDDPIRRVPVSARDLLATPLAQARRDAEAAGLRFETPGELPDAGLNADPAAIARVIDNIVQNALYHAAGATVIAAQAAIRTGVLEVSFADNGPGFGAEDLSHVFEPFYRGDGARASHRGGAGLGLAICRRLVEHHGGTISAETRGGAVLTFRLPVAMEGEGCRVQGRTGGSP